MRERWLPGTRHCFLHGFIIPSHKEKQTHTDLSSRLHPLPSPPPPLSLRGTGFKFLVVCVLPFLQQISSKKDAFACCCGSAPKHMMYFETNAVVPCAPPLSLMVLYQSPSCLYLLSLISAPSPIIPFVIRLEEH